MQSAAIIKEVKIRAQGAVVTFDKFGFTTGQAEQLGDLAIAKEKVMVTIEPIQPQLPGTEKQ